MESDWRTASSAAASQAVTSAPKSLGGEEEALKAALKASAQEKDARPANVVTPRAETPGKMSKAKGDIMFGSCGRMIQSLPKLNEEPRYQEERQEEEVQEEEG